VQRQLIVNGEVLARYGDELVANGTGTEFTPTSVAEFQFGAAPLNVRQSNLDAQRYTVSDGETLRSIARSFYGDDKLWYLIAQANGLSGSTQLSTGQTLSIPKLSASSNAADSFRAMRQRHYAGGGGGHFTLYGQGGQQPLGMSNVVVGDWRAVSSIASQVVNNAIGAGYFS
jgi:LysM repeat protein